MKNSHIDCVVEMHIRCFPDFFLTSLGSRFLRQYYESLLCSSRSLALVLEEDKGWIKGFVTGVTNPSGFYKELLKKDWHRFFLAAIPSAFMRPTIIPRLLRAFKKPNISVDSNNKAELTSLCVAPSEENKGYGQELVGAFLHEARGRGCKEIVLYTDAQGNEKVNRFYSELGFQVARSYVTPEGRNMNEYIKEIG